MASFTSAEVAEWDIDSVAGWLDIVGLKDCIDTFRENDVDGKALLEMLTDDDMIGELGISFAQGKTLLGALELIKNADAATSVDPSAEEWPSDDDSDLDIDDDPAKEESAAVSAGSAPSISSGGKRPKTKKKKDPLRLAAKSRSVATLESSTVTSGYLYKVGGSGLKMKHWNKRFFVLTDDNCVYYFKSPKDMSALGLIMLPSYTITTVDKAENPGGRPFTWKAVNRVDQTDRKYIFAAETEAEMKAWMNVMSLASIAYGSGKASTAKQTSNRLAADAELEGMQERASARAGGVSGGDVPIAAVQTAPQTAVVPAHLAKTAKDAKKAGRTLALIKLLDGQTLQLYAESSTTGQMFLDQVCTLISAYEKYYFGLSFLDKKGDQQWIETDQKVLKHDFPKGSDYLELSFMIRYPPIDVTQVMQYVTLYQAFLAARRDVVTERIVTTGKDSMLLAALSLQAIRGDYDPSVHSKASLSPSDLVPAKTMREARLPGGIHPSKLEDFWRDELIRCWLKTQGILKHLAVLKYMQIIQKHRLYGMTFVDVKNKKGTPLTLGIAPKGLNVYRAGKTDFPVVKFGWGECSELAFAEKKFTISTADKNTKPFSVYCSRTKIALRVLKQCVGSHKLFVQTVQDWANAPPDLAAMRQAAVKAALEERAKLKEESAVAGQRAEELRQKSTAASSAQSATAQATTSDAVRSKTSELIDVMMNDPEFMRMQEEMMKSMADEIGDGYDDVAGDVGGEEPMAGRERCASTKISDRAEYLESLGQPGL